VTTKYFNVKNGMTTGNLLVSESNVTLGNVSNLHISGGTSGYILQTDGSGSLSWASPSSTQSPAPMPLTVDTGNTLTISANYQGLYGTPITVDGTIAIDGILVDVSGQGAPGSNAQVTFNDNGDPAGNNGFTFNKTTGDLAVPGGLTVTGNILPSGDVTYDLGNSTRRFRDLYLSGNTIYLGNANLTANGSTLTLPAGTVITGTGTVGNIANLNLTGNSGQVLYGNGTFAGVSSTTAQTVTVNAQPNITSVGTLTTLTTSGLFTAGGNIIPSANNTFSLGNATNYFKDAYIGPGSLYINGTKVLEEASQEIVITADLNQTVKVSTSGSGDISLDPTGTGSILVKGALQMQAGENITTSNGSPVTIATGVKADSLTTYSANTNLTISANGSGIVNINDDLTVQGNLIIDGGAGNLSVTSLSVQDNIIDLSAETTGTPTANAGIRVVRGDQSAVQLRWTEPSTSWQFTNDGTNYLTMVGTTSAGATALGNAATANYFAGTLTTASQPNITSTGTLTGLTVNGVSNLGAIGNVIITGGTNGQVLSTNGSGNLSWTSISSTSISNGNSNVSVASAAGNVNISVNGTANVVSVSSTGADVTGTLTAGNLSTGGNLTVSGNAVVSGNLNVEGNLVYINVSTLSVSDPIIQLQTGPNGAAPTSNSGKDVGTGLNYYDTQARVAFMGFDVSNNEFGMASVATITNEVVTFTTYGNLRVGNIIGNGQALSGLVGGNVSGQVGNALVAGTVYTAAQPNITSVGTLSSLSVTGNISAGNVSATTFTGALSGAATSATTAGTVTTAAQPNITSVGTLSSLSVTGNANVGNIGATSGVFTNVSGNGSALTSITGANVTGQVTYAATANAVAGANVSGAVSYATTANSVAGANVSGQVGNALVAGTVYTAAQPNITSVGTLTSLAVTGNISAGNVSATTFTGALSGAATSATTAGTVTTAAQPNITSVGTLTSLTVSGTITGTVSSATTAGTVTTAAQPNITSVGTLTSLTVTGNVTAGNVTASSGTITAATLTETSSIALKENFRPIENPLEKVLQLVGKMYDRKDGSNKDEVGLVSEEVEKIIPELVKNDTVAYTRLTVYLLESIKVLKDEIDSLKGNKRKTKK
jgi:hypothetical protein